jgi:O-antigen/teichoic acid export membrane protein
VFGIPSSIYYFYHRAEHRPHGRATLIAQSFWMLGISGAVAAIAIYLGAPFIAHRFDNPQLAALFHPFAIFVGLAIFGELFMHVMISQNRYTAAVSLETIEAILRVGLIVGVLYAGFGLQAVVVAMATFACFRLLGRGYFLVTGPDSIRHARRAAAFPVEQLAYSIPLAASTCVALIGNTLDRMIVAAFFSPVEYAIYSVGALEIPLDVIFQASVANVLRATLPPLVTAGAYQEIVRIWRASVRKLALVIIPSAVFLFAFAELFITALFTPKYLESAAVFRVYVVHLPQYMVVVSLIPQIFGRTGLNLKVIFVAASSNIVLSFAFLKLFGYIGPAMAFVLSSYIGLSLYFVAGKRLLGTTFAEMMPLAALARTFLAACVSLLPALLAAHYLPAGIVALAGAGIAFSCGYLAAAPALGAVTAEDVRAIRTALQRIPLSIGRRPR